NVSSARWWKNLLNFHWLPHSLFQRSLLDDVRDGDFLWKFLLRTDPPFHLRHKPWRAAKVLNLHSPRRLIARCQMAEPFLELCAHESGLQLAEQTAANNVGALVPPGSLFLLVSQPSERLRCFRENDRVDRDENRGQRGDDRAATF